MDPGVYPWFRMGYSKRNEEGRQRGQKQNDEMVEQFQEGMELPDTASTRVKSETFEVTDPILCSKAALRHVRLLCFTCGSFSCLFFFHLMNSFIDFKFSAHPIKMSSSPLPHNFAYCTHISTRAYMCSIC